MAEIDLARGTPWANVDLYDGVLKANIDYIMGGIRYVAAPDAPSGTPAIWYDADQITGLNHGDPMAQWDDESGNSHNLLQPSAGIKPQYRTNQQNGLPAVWFNLDYMRTAVIGTDPFTLTQPITVFFVIKVNDITGADHFIFDGGGTERVRLLQDDSTFQLSAGTWVLSATDEGSSFEIITLRFDGDSSFIRLNGSANDVVAGIGAGSFIARLTLGASDSNSKPFQGLIGEMLVYDGAEDPTANEAYLAYKWGISI